MLTQKRFVTLAVTAAAALVPALGAQASIPRDARIVPVELCHPKWVLQSGRQRAAALTRSGSVPMTIRDRI